MYPQYINISAKVVPPSRLGSRWYYNGIAKLMTKNISGHRNGKKSMKTRWGCYSRVFTRYFSIKNSSTETKISTLRKLTMIMNEVYSYS